MNVLSYNPNVSGLSCKFGMPLDKCIIIEARVQFPWHITQEHALQIMSEIDSSQSAVKTIQHQW